MNGAETDLPLSLATVDDMRDELSRRGFACLIVVDGEAKNNPDQTCTFATFAGGWAHALGLARYAEMHLAGMKSSAPPVRNSEETEE